MEPNDTKEEIIPPKKSNCLFFAIPKWLRKSPPGEETYLIFRRSRINWGILHCLVGTLDPLTNQIKVESYKPPLGHKKTKFAPVFEGTIVEGDADSKMQDLT